MGRELRRSSTQRRTLMIGWSWARMLQRKSQRMRTMRLSMPTWVLKMLGRMHPKLAQRREAARRAVRRGGKLRSNSPNELCQLVEYPRATRRRAIVGGTWLVAETPLRATPHLGGRAYFIFVT